MSDAALSPCTVCSKPTERGMGIWIESLLDARVVPICENCSPERLRPLPAGFCHPSLVPKLIEAAQRAQADAPKGDPFLRLIYGGKS